VSRIQTRFDNLRKSGRKALIPYIMAGDPAPALTVPLLHALVDSGADILELGVPFSDPMADGPAIQASSLRALKAGMTLTMIGVFSPAMARRLRPIASDWPRSSASMPG